MSVLTAADALYIGDRRIDRVYAGALRVWPPRSYRDVVMEDEPLSYWRFQEQGPFVSGTTQAADEMGARPLTYRYTVTSAEGPFPGSRAIVTNNGRADRQNDASLSRGDNFTMEAWVYPTSTSSVVGRVVSNNAAGSHGYSLYRAANNYNFGMQFYAATGVSWLPTTLELNEWHHIVYTQQGSRVWLYVDAEGVMGTYATVTPTAYSFIVGASGSDWNTLGSMWTGRIAEVAYYDKVLTPAQVTAHYEAVRGPLPRGDYYRDVIVAAEPVSYWRLRELELTDPAVDEMGRHPLEYKGSLTLGGIGPFRRSTGITIPVGTGTGPEVVPAPSLSGLTQFSVELWVREVAYSSARGIWSSRRAGGTALGMSLQVQATTLRILNSNSTYTDLIRPEDGNLTLSASTWRHYVTTFDGTTVRQYFDGELRGTATPSGFAPDTSAANSRFKIGEGWGGSVAEVAVYSRVLPQEEIADHWDAGVNPPSEPDIIRVGESATVVFHGDDQFNNTYPATDYDGLRTIMESLNPHLFCHTGDMCNYMNTTQLPVWDRVFSDGSWAARPQAAAASTRRRYRVSPGNHDITPPQGNAGLWEEYWQHAQSSWHSFDFSNGWHGISLRVVGDAPMSPQQTEWLRRDLSRNRDKPTFLYYHSSRWSTASYGNMVESRAAWEMFPDFPQVEFVVTGHQHVYQRFRRLDPDGNLDLDDGVVQFVNISVCSRSDGRQGSIAGWESRLAAYALSDSNWGFLAVKLYADRYEWCVYGIGPTTGTQNPAWPATMVTDTNPAQWNSQAVRVVAVPLEAST